jgi:hypothetical protein
MAIDANGITLSNNQEVTLQQRPKTSLVLGEGEMPQPRPRSVSTASRSAPTLPRSRTQTRYAAPQPGVPRPVRSRTIPRTAVRSQPPLSDKDTETIQKLVQKLHSLKRNGEELSEADERARQEIMEALKAAHSQRLSKREAESLDHLGNRLDPNAAGSAGSN